MPWKETCAMDERKEFILAALGREASVSELCRRWGISRKTGYKWLERYEEIGSSGLSDRSHAPLRCVLPILPDQSVTHHPVRTTRQYGLRGGGKNTGTSPAPSRVRVSLRNRPVTRFWLAAVIFASIAMAPAQAGLSGCPNCTLTGKDYSNQCLQFANFEGAKLDGAKMVLTCLSHANLKSASLRGADLSGANLFQSKLDAADFTGAVMSSTSLKDADLSRTKGLTQAQLDTACGDAKTRVPKGLTVKMCQ